MDFYSTVEKIVKKDKRYGFDAYEFVMHGLRYAQKKFKKKGHVTGQELSVAIKDYAIKQFGFLAKTVLEHWGIRKTDDFGEIVYVMIRVGLMKKNDGDSKDDFKDVYSFDEAFNVEPETLLVEGQ
jgi:uncharacterized repeat protein (TIGR04138 family)